MDENSATKKGETSSKKEKSGPKRKKILIQDIDGNDDEKKTPAVKTSEEYEIQKEKVQSQLKNGKLEAKDLYILASLMARWKRNDSLPVCLLCQKNPAPKKGFGLGHLIPLSILKQSKLGTFVDVSNGIESGVKRMGYNAFCSKCEDIFCKYGEKKLNSKFFKKFHDQQDNELKIDFGGDYNWLYFAIMSIIWRCLCFKPLCEGFSEILEDLRMFLRDYPNCDDVIDSKVRIYLFAPNDQLESKWKDDNEAHKIFFQGMYTAEIGGDDLHNANYMGAWVFMGPIHIMMTYSTTEGIPQPPMMTEKDLREAECCRFKYKDKTIWVKKKQERFFPLSMYGAIVAFGKRAISLTIRIKTKKKLTPFVIRADRVILLPSYVFYENGTFSIPKHFTKKFDIFLPLIAGEPPSITEIQILGACVRGNERVILIAVEDVVKYSENDETKYGPLAMALNVSNDGKVSYLRGVHIPSEFECDGYDFRKEIPFKELIEEIIDELIKDGKAKWL